MRRSLTSKCGPFLRRSFVLWLLLVPFFAADLLPARISLAESPDTISGAVGTVSVTMRVNQAVELIVEKVEKTTSQGAGEREAVFTVSGTVRANTPWALIVGQAVGSSPADPAKGKPTTLPVVSIVPISSGAAGTLPASAAVLARGEPTAGYSFTRRFSYEHD